MGLLQIRRRKDPTMPQGGNVTVLWFTRCCERREGAERVDQVLKYCSSCGLSLLLCILSFYICSVQVPACPPGLPKRIPLLSSACHMLFHISGMHPLQSMLVLLRP
jgi:hypothetical protein